jgi:tRNA(fMet)-specific endonuclease VapC
MLSVLATSVIPWWSTVAAIRPSGSGKGSFGQTAPQQLLTVLDAFDILPFEMSSEITYDDLHARLEAAGKPIAGNDMLIAAHAVLLGHTILTDNEQEFSRVDGLAFENWLRF